MTGSVRWSRDEDRILREMWIAGATDAEVMARLPGRSRAAVKIRAEVVAAGVSRVVARWNQRVYDSRRRRGL